MSKSLLILLLVLSGCASSGTQYDGDMSRVKDTIALDRLIYDLMQRK